MKTAPASAWHAFVEKAKKFYVVNIKGYDPKELVVVTLLFEGDEQTCKRN